MKGIPKTHLMAGRSNEEAAEWRRDRRERRPNLMAQDRAAKNQAIRNRASQGQTNT
jgi:hypothetical protein